MANTFLGYNSRSFCRGPRGQDGRARMKNTKTLKYRAAAALGVLGAASFGLFLHAQGQQAPSPSPAAPAGRGAGRGPTTQQKYPHVSQTDGYRFVPDWPQKPAEAQWRAMSSL